MTPTTTHRDPKFSISILAMNGLEMTKRCIESVQKHSKNYELILTDNASDDGTAAYFDSLAGPRIKVIHNDTNQGFSAPNNYALTQATGRYFVCLNNDAEVPARWLTLLEEPLLKHWKTAAISGPEGSPCSFQAPYPSFHGSLGPNLEYIEGSCLCIPTDLAREWGLFATYLSFAYGEDADLSLRMRAYGYTIHQCPFKIKHLRRQSAQLVPNIDEFQKTNHAALLQRWGNYLKFRRFDLPFVVRREGAIGDVLLTTPLISEIKRQQPRSEIYVETKFPELFRDNPAVTNAGGPFPEVYRWANIIDLNMSYENMTETSIIDAYFKHAHFMGPTRQLVLNPSTEELRSAYALRSNKKMVAIHAGPTTWAGKNWPWERWERLCQWFLSNSHPWRVVLVGDKGEPLPHFYDLRGKTSFHELAAALHYCRLFVGVDSFPMHVAQSQGCPVVGLFGASSPDYILSGCSPQEPVVGVSDCAGARHRVAGQTFVDCAGACMESITVPDVIAAIEKLTK